ncbi:MAG: hypothetical protein H7326_10430 [Bdellovibrionaceae bacterium]|nr:hypothetical protein [Pseudobdellovibrionaceae bacterium]
MRQFEKKIYIGMILLVAGFVPLIAASFLSVGQVVNAQNDVISSNAQELVQAERLRYLDSTMSSLIPVYVLSGDEALVQEFNQRNEQFKELSLKLLSVESDEYSRRMIQDVQKTAEQRFAAAGPGIELKRRGAKITEVNEYFLKSSGELSQQLQSKLQALAQRESDDMALARNDLSKMVSWVVASLIVLVCFSIILVVYIGRQMAKAIQQKKSYDDAQLRLLEQERKLSQARKETVEVVSHDLKSPLGSIKMCIEMMLEDTSEIPQFKGFQEDLNLIHRSAISMERLIRDLLDHSKIEAGQLVLDKKECDVCQLVEELAKRFEPLAKAKNLKLNTQVKNPGLKSYCDVGRIEQVLSNLMSNAIKFTPTNGEVNVGLSLTDERELLFSVEDSGPGMSADQLQHIFERFWQVRETASQGTGLGLAIAKAIVDGHQGRIWVESTPDEGSIFFFTLPSAPSKRPAARRLPDAQV